MQLDPARGSSQTNPAPAAKPGNKADSFSAVLDDFLKVAFQTPAEKARAAVLEKHDLTEEQYEALTPKQRDAIDEEIALAIRRVTERDTNVPLASQPFLSTLQQLARI